MKSFQNAEFNQVNYILTKEGMRNQKGRWYTQHVQEKQSTEAKLISVSKNLGQQEEPSYGEGCIKLSGLCDTDH